MQANPAALLNSKNLDLAYEHAVSAWFPFNPTVLKNVRSRIESGYYSEKRESLVEDLKSDFSLYFYCLKELRLLLKDKRRTGSAGHSTRSSQRKYPDFTEIIRNASLNDIRRIFEKSEKSISRHSLSEINPTQAARLRESILSASAAEALAAKLRIDPELGFACALLRQLGLTLIAWNYPNVYRRSLESLTEFEQPSSNELDILLHSSLGFSPTMLGVRIAQSWGIPSEIIAVLQTTDSPKKASPLPGRRASSKSSEQTTLAKICIVGEAFARANNPQQYPTARDDWDHAELVIKKHLGSKGISTIYRKAHQLSSHYASIVPQALQIEDKTKVHPSLVDSDYAHSLYDRNVYLKACPAHVRDKIAVLYSQLRPGAVSNELLQRLIHEILPEVGISCSCIFMLDPTSAALMPVLKVGTPSFIKVRPQSLMNSRSHLNPITSAFSKKAPICEEGLVSSGEKRIFIAGTLGDHKTIGVLYLEFSQQSSSQLSIDSVLLFRAITMCLNDLLHLT